MWANSFDLLEQEAGRGGVEAVHTAKAKKPKKKNKKPAPDQPAPSAPAPSQPVLEESDDFQPARARAIKPATSSGLPTRAVDAQATLEKAAHSAQSRSDLVQKWTEQVARGDQHFQDTSGAKLTFAQVLGGCNALDRLLDGYLGSSSTVSAAEASSLGELLAAVAHPSLPASFGPLLAKAVATLAGLVAADPLAPAAPARRSLEASVALLKAGVPKPQARASPAAKLAALEASVAKQEAGLARTTLPKEQGKLWLGLLDALSQELDLLQAGGAGGVVPEVGAAMRPLQELQGAIDARIKALSTPAAPARSVQDQVAAAQVAHKQEDAALGAQLSAAEARIKRLEAELAAVKVEAAALRQQRVAAATHHVKVLEQLSSGKSPSRLDSKGALAALEAGRGAASALAAAVEGAGGSGASPDAGAAGALAQRLSAAEVPRKLVAAVQQVVDLNMGLLQELGGKATFYRERLAQAARQAEQLARLNMGDAKKGEESRRQRGSLDKMLSEVLAGAEAAAKAVRGAVDTYQARLPALLSVPGFEPPSPELSAGLEAKAAEAVRLAAAIADPATVVPQAVAAPPPLPPPRSTPVSAASEPVVPAPAPAAGRSAAPGSGRQRAVQPPAPPPGPAPMPEPATLDMSSLAARLAALEEANRQKDAQIAAMLSSAAAVDVAAPLAALGLPLSSSLLSSPLGLMPGSATSPLVPSPLANGHHATEHVGTRKESGGRRRRA